MFDLAAGMVLEGWLGRPFKDIAPLSNDDVEGAQGARALDNFLQLCNTTMNNANRRAGEQLMSSLNMTSKPFNSFANSLVFSNALCFENGEDGSP